ncbi:response regulator transcription factor [Pedobacter panaciterrae]|jgi:Response regulators consisting of a CheY-like receiver domain and a winged-helix DNA-binding domain|uniref:response regulator transcription factor n=1 Tax=Pedobacter panaciterrae TaxID=363849 RepID=UPI00155DC60E|nr:response regulator transcription factor [Pedobacter panaciterrae]NQX56382.1 response regulator transcription factor [Pedobacter panaciterrae]
MVKLKILLAEDEPFLGKIIKESFETRDFEVSWVQNGIKAYSVFRSFQPDICILDVMMPEKDGFSVTEDIRKVDTAVPILFLTARSLTEDVIKGFEMGCNDYLKKPFSMEELIVRVKSLLGRSERHKTNLSIENFSIGNYEFNNTIQELTLGNESVKLSFREASLLKMLIENKNQVLARKLALDYLWGEDNFFAARSMDVFITKLRKHLKHDTNIEIVNIRGVGYKLIIND